MTVYAQSIKNYVIGFVDGSIYTLTNVYIAKSASNKEHVCFADENDDVVANVYTSNTLFITSEENYYSHFSQR